MFKVHVYDTRARQKLFELSYRVLNRRDQINEFIVIMSKKGKRNRGGQVKIVLMVSLVLIVLFRSFRIAVSALDFRLSVLSSILKFPNVLDLQSQKSTYNA